MLKTSERFKQIRNYLNLSQTEMSAKMGISKNAWQSYELGKSSPGTGVYLGLALLGFSVDWLLTGQGHLRYSKPTAGMDDLVFLSRFGPDSMGFSSAASIIAFDAVAFDRRWLELEIKKDASELQVLIPESDSMMPTISPGDVLLVDRSKKFLCGDGIYVFSMNGFCQIKRVQNMGDGTIKIMSDNPLYDTVVLSNADVDKIVIGGKIVWRGTRI